MKRASLLAIATLLAAACSIGEVSQESPRQFRVPAADATHAHRLTLSSGDTLEVVGGVVVLRGRDGGKIAENARVARGLDPKGTCPSDGFRSVEAFEDGFVLRNMLCSGWFFIDETMVFAPDDGTYRLIRFSAEYHDRRTAEPDGPPRVLTEDALGGRRFDDLDPDELYRFLD